MRSWIALCAILAALMMNITSAFHKKRFGTSVPIVVNGTGTLLLNLSLSRRCERLTLSIRNNRHGKGVQIAIDFVETLLQPVSVTISEENIQSRNALPSNSKCSQPRTVSCKITLRNNTIDFRIGERWRLIHYTRRPYHYDLFSIEVNKSKAQCCFVFGTAEWKENERKPIIKIRTATVLNARQLESDNRSESSSNLEKGFVDSKISPQLRTPATLTRGRFDYGSNISAIAFGSNAGNKHSFTSSTANHNSWSLATYRNVDYTLYASTMPTKRRSGRRNSVNDEWTPTFLAFFGIEVFFISSFIIFGLVMFACLQRHPKQSRVRHHSSNV